jgi:hypothetical protein
MIAHLIGLAVFAFIIFVLVKGLQRPSRVRNIPPVINDVKPRQSCNVSPLARDRQEVLEIWEKCASDSSCPPPIPPVKPTVYFGNETVAGGFDVEPD